MLHKNRNFQRRTSALNRGWSGLSLLDIQVPAVSKIFLGSFQLNNDGIDETVLRSVGDWTVAGQSDGTYLVAIGMILVTDTALAEGVAAIPFPLFDIESDGWFLYDTILGE